MLAWLSSAVSGSDILSSLTSPHLTSLPFQGITVNSQLYPTPTISVYFYRGCHYIFLMRQNLYFFYDIWNVGSSGCYDVMVAGLGVVPAEV